MKRFIAFFLAAISLLLVACGEPVKQGTVTEQGFIDPETGIEYVYCDSMKLFPIEPYDATDDEDNNPDVYITLDSDLETEEFYKVWFEDPERFLCYEYSGFYYLVRNKELAEPTIMEFNPIAAQVFNSTNLVFLHSFYADDEYFTEEAPEHSQDTWLCQLIAEHLTNGENVDVPVTEYNIEDLYYFHLISKDYPGIYYQVAFFGYNGRYFLRDSSANKTVYCPREIILRMVPEE